MILFSALIFDLDGTLIDSSRDIADSSNHMLKALGLPERPVPVLRDFVGDGMRTLLLRTLGKGREELLPKALEIFRAHYLEHCLDSTSLYPGAKGTLDFFSGKKMALVTNKPLEMTEKVLKHFNIRRHFSVVLGGESVKNKKPHPEPVINALKGLGTPPQNALMIGDGTTDMDSGRAAGVRTCAVTYGYRSRNELEAYRPDFFIDRIEGLKDIVE